MKSTLKVEEKFAHPKSFVILKPNFFTRIHQGYETSSQFSWIFPHPLFQLICSDGLI